jgi:hypothetical protein
MIGDVNLFLKGTLPRCEERIDDEEFEAEVEIMIAGVFRLPNFLVSFVKKRQMIQRKHIEEVDVHLKHSL